MINFSKNQKISSFANTENYDIMSVSPLKRVYTEQNQSTAGIFSFYTRLLQFFPESIQLLNT